MKTGVYYIMYFAASQMTGNIFLKDQLNKVSKIKRKKLYSTSYARNQNLKTNYIKFT